MVKLWVPASLVIGSNEVSDSEHVTVRSIRSVWDLRKIDSTYWHASCQYIAVDYVSAENVDFVKRKNGTGTAKKIRK